MRDYTVHNYCDFLWINDLLELKRDSKNRFVAEVKKNNKSTVISISNVTIFGTIIEIKPVAGGKGFLYYVDDGTGVIVCKHSPNQFDEVIRLIENEQSEVLNQTSFFKINAEQNSMFDSSIDDSIFNDRSMQVDEIDVSKRSQLQELQSIWYDIFESFTNLIDQYNIGDSVYIQGKLYNYFNVNQIYINNIRQMDLTEELVKISTKLEDGFESLVNVDKSRNESFAEKRFSGLMTFDHIHHLNSKPPFSRHIATPERKADVLQADSKVVTPNLNSTITFDTFSN